MNCQYRFLFPTSFLILRLLFDQNRSQSRSFLPSNIFDFWNCDCLRFWAKRGRDLKKDVCTEKNATDDASRILGSSAGIPWSQIQISVFFFFTVKFENVKNSIKKLYFEFGCLNFSQNLEVFPTYILKAGLDFRFLTCDLVSQSDSFKGKFLKKKRKKSLLKWKLFSKNSENLEKFIRLVNENQRSEKFEIYFFDLSLGFVWCWFRSSIFISFLL